jgi:hypothetical protein
MNNLRFILILFFFYCFTIQAQWDTVGVKGFSNSVADTPFLKINPVTQEPYIVFRDAINYSEATVMRFDGNNWVYVGSPGFSDGDVFLTTIAFDKTGIPYVAYGDCNNNYKATVMKFDGNNWTPVGTSGFTPGAASYPNIALDSNGTPYVAFRDQGDTVYYSWPNGFRASVMKFDGNNWVYVGAPGFSAGTGPYGASFTTISFDKNNVPYIAYSDDFNGNRATVQKFDGTNWVYVGAHGFANWKAEYSRSMVFDSQNRPYIVCSVSGRVTVMRFENGNWTAFGNPSFSQGGAEYASIAIDNNDIVYVGFQDYGVTRKASVMKYDGTNWVYLGQQGFTPSSTQHSTVDVDKYGNVYIGYADSSTPHWYASVMKFTNNTADIKEIENNCSFNIYPNPTGSIFNVYYKGDAAELIINITNQLGQNILSKKYSSQSELNDSFDLSSQPKGVYFIEIVVDGKREVKKIVVH